MGTVDKMNPPNKLLFPLILFCLTVNAEESRRRRHAGYFVEGITADGPKRKIELEESKVPLPNNQPNKMNIGESKGPLPYERPNKITEEKSNRPLPYERSKKMNIEESEGPTPY